MDHIEVNSRRGGAWLAGGLLLALALIAVVATLGGRSGCRSSDENLTAEEQKKKEAAEKKKKKKPDYQFWGLETLPSDDTLARNWVKPGHAVTAWVPVVANYADLRGDFETSVTDISSRPIRIGDTKYHLVMSRPAVLPKGQKKFLEPTFFIPGERRPTDLSSSNNVFLQHTLKTARGGRVVHEDSQITQSMADCQYLFAVLSTNPNAYGYLKQLESVTPYYNELVDDEGQLVYYRVVLPSIEQRVPLPSHPFAWTMIAYILWDDMEPDALSPAQKQAMLDWLHWGGQLMVSGPGSIDQLEGSFLDPYLPVTAHSAVGLGPEELEDMDQTWSLVSEKTGERLALAVQEATPMVGVALEQRQGGEFLEGTGQLVAERRVGRGRIVVTAFPLSHRDIVNWKSYDSFFNACLMRRPSREFSADRLGALRAEWVGQRGGRANPLYVTSTRYFTRDIGSYAYVPPNSSPKNGGQVDWHWDGCEPHPVSGIGGWDDFSGASNAARTTLSDAAGVTIPQARFVLGALVVYLVVLVPVNWCVFRVLGRVEWAWIAAPVIAILGAVAVIRFAQLDIGFVRSRTEIAVVEVHGGHNRAHLTRYTALYSSLSSSYELRFEDVSAVSRPFPPTLSPDRLWPVTYRRERDVALSGFQVDSNTTGFVHSEQMFEMGGPIRLVGDRLPLWEVENGSDIELHHVGVLYRTPTGSVLTCWLEKLHAKTTVPLNFGPAQAEGTPWLTQWEAVGEATGEAEGVADLSKLTELAARGTSLRPGDVRLVGWTSGFLPGLTISPEASQTESSGIVLVHLRQGPLGPPVPDVNIAAEIRESTEWDEDPDGALEVLPEDE